MSNYSRPLNTRPTVEDFLTRALRFDFTTKYRKVVSMIVDSEKAINNGGSNNETLSCLEARDQEYREENVRWKLREKIIDELFKKKRLKKDDNMRLGSGGALPRTKVKSQSKAFIIIGLPASGKSSIASKISDDYGAIILDNDFAKRKLPEYGDHSYGASLVHEESDEITFGFRSGNPFKIKSLYRRCLSAKHNIVIPKIGQNPASIITLAKALIEQDKYEVHLILVSLPKQIAASRAVMRFHDSKRYVPLGLIFDWYGNDPSHSYYYLRCKQTKLFKSFGVISTVNKPANHTDILGISPVSAYTYADMTLELP